MSADEEVVWTEPRDQEVLVQESELRDYVQRLYEAAGVPEAHAKLMAELQTETDVRGVHSHGTRQAPGYIRRILSGHTNGKAKVTVKKEGPSFAIVDNDGGMGHLGSVKAMELAIEKAAETGIAAAVVVESRHFGAAFNYSMMAARRDQIGFCVSSSSPGLAPWGGSDRLLGNDPVAYAIPAGEERPIVLDMASGVSAWGRIGTMRMYGKKLTDDWVLDEDGRPTNDPSAAHVLLPFGKEKGSGLAMVMDVLAAVLPFGLATPHRVGEEYQGQKRGSHYFQAIDIGAFCEVAKFKREIDRFIRTVRDSRLREGSKRIYAAGEIEWLKKEAWRKSGIPMHVKHVGSLEEIGKELGVEGSLT